MKRIFLALWYYTKLTAWYVLALPLLLIGERLLCAVLVLFTPRFSAMFFWRDRHLIISKVRDSIIINTVKEKHALKYTIATLQRELDKVRRADKTPVKPLFKS